MGYLGFLFTGSEDEVIGNLEEDVFQKDNTLVFLVIEVHNGKNKKNIIFCFVSYRNIKCMF